MSSTRLEPYMAVYYVTNVPYLIQVNDSILVMDVWPDTAECWASVEDLWRAMDTLDHANDPPTCRGFVTIKTT